MTPEQLIARAEAAKRILEDPLVQEAFKTLETDVCEAWMKSGIRDAQGQHELLLMAQTARKFKAIFETLVQTGEVERHRLSKPKLHRVLDRFGVR